MTYGHRTAHRCQIAAIAAVMYLTAQPVADQPTDHGNERNIAGLLPGLRELLGREATNQRRSEGNGPNR